MQTESLSVLFRFIGPALNVLHESSAMNQIQFKVPYPIKESCVESADGLGDNISIATFKEGGTKKFSKSTATIFENMQAK